MKLNEHKNSKSQGNVGVGAAIAYATRMGYCVSIPLNDSQDYDLIFEIDDQLVKIQVKTSRYTEPSGSYTVQLRRTGGNQSYHTAKPFDASKVDYLFVLVGNGDTYFIPTHQIDTVNAITVGNKYQEYKC